jgi:hypothetical protein
VGIENLANFLSISPNQVFAVRLSGPRAGLSYHSCFNLCSVSRKAINLFTYLLYFKVAKWAVSSLTHSSNSFRVLLICLFKYSNRRSNIATAEFLVISAETACWEIEKNSQIFNEAFYLPLYLIP